MSAGQTAFLLLALGALALAIGWLWPRVGLWWQLREALALHRAREDMEAALWAECTADAARVPMIGEGKPPPMMGTR